MKTDPRLRPHHPGEIRYLKEVEAKRQTLEHSVTEGTWRELVEPLSELVVARIEGSAIPNTVYPTFCDDRFKEAFEQVRDLILEGQPVHCDGDFGHVLIKHLAHSLSVRLLEGVDPWTKAAAFFKVSTNWASFLESIPAERIDSQIGDLIDCQLSVRDYFDGIDVTVDQLAVAVLDEEKDALEQVWNHKRVADYCGLSHECQVRSVLLGRSSPANWSHWLEGLPHPVIQLVALNTVEDLDFLEAVLEELTFDRPSVRSDGLLFLSVVWRTICLWEDIDDGIDQMSRQNFDGSKEVRNLWESDELPIRIQRLVSVLESIEEGLEVGALLLRHISPFRGPQFKVLPSRDQLRDELLSLSERSIMALETSCLLRRPSVTSLTAAALLAIRLPTAEHLNAVLRSYEEWLTSTNYVWHRKFEDPDKELLQTLSAVLAKSLEPLTHAHCFIDAVREPAQGWKFNYDRWLKSVPKLCHGLVVVSLAAVKTADDEGRGEKSSALMGLAWNEFHSMIEYGIAESRQDELASPLAYVWCCAGKTFDGGEEEITQAICIFRHPELVLCAVANLAVYGKLSEKIKQVVSEEMDRLIKFYRRDRKFSVDDEVRIRKELGEILLPRS